MKNVGSWLRQAGMNFANSIQRMMMGRYGHDRLNVALLVVGLILTVISMFLSNKLLVLVTTLLSYMLLFLALFRSFSRNTYKRYNENRRFLLMIDRIKDRSNRYYSCPKCRQTVRVPRGKGKIAITCPKCREKFIKKT
jgi:hypothetical protein